MPRFGRTSNNSAPTSSASLVPRRSYYSMRDLVRFLRADYPETPLVVGGNHVTTYAVQTLVETGCDFVVMGEGEYTMLALIEALSSGTDPAQVAGLAFRDKSGQTVVTPPAQLVEDPDLTDAA